MENDLSAQAAELLERAADGFESGRYYWTRGQYYRNMFGTAAYCSMGALAHENGQDNKSLSHVHPVLSAASRALAAQMSPDTRIPAWAHGGDVVVSFNDRTFYDDKGRKISRKPEVIEAMKQAAKDLRNGG